MKNRMQSLMQSAIFYNKINYLQVRVIPLKSSVDFFVWKARPVRTEMETLQVSKSGVSYDDSLVRRELPYSLAKRMLALSQGKTCNQSILRQVS